MNLLKELGVEGKEVIRREGFLDKKAIVAVLQKLGVKQGPSGGCGT